MRSFFRKTLISVSFISVLIWGFRCSYLRGDKDGHRRIAFQRLLETQALFSKDTGNEKLGVMFIDNALRYAERFPDLALKGIDLKAFEMAFRLHKNSYCQLFVGSELDQIGPARFSLRAGNSTVRVSFPSDPEMSFGLKIGDSGPTAMNVYSQKILSRMKAASSIVSE